MGGYAKSENGNKAYSKNQVESTEIDDGIGGGSGDSGATLKKGPWTASEDAILVEYVKKHGEGNWNAVQKNSGLFRCGKSCRLRWANHLRPNLKKGPFTQEEERLIMELHARMGNKWARMAAHLPGRTDNEIKNYWNTRVKRLQRVGLPLYPPDVCSEAVQEGQQGDGSGGMDTGGKICFDSLQTKNYDIPNVALDGYVPKFAGLPPSCTQVKSFDVHPNLSVTMPTMHRQKRLRQLTTLPGYSGSGTYGFSSFGHFQEDPNEIFAQHYNFSLSPGPDPARKISLSCSAMQGSQSLSTGNSSASKSTFVAVKTELPSLQYSETNMGGWARSSPPPPLFDSIDTFIQTPPEIGTFETESASPRNSGLLDALVYEGKALRAGKNNSYKSTDSSAVTPREICDSSNINVCESEIEDQGDPVSPFGQSATSLLNEHTPVSASGSSLDEQLPGKNFTEGIVKSEPEPENGWTELQAKGTTSQLSFTRPDVLLASDWLEQTPEYVKEQSLMSDPVATLFDGDFGGDLSSLRPSWSNLPAGFQGPSYAEYFCLPNL